jgi:hypothetical protein
VVIRLELETRVSNSTYNMCGIMEIWALNYRLEAKTYKNLC